MANVEIPPAEQSVSKMIALQHQIAEEHTPQGNICPKVINVKLKAKLSQKLQTTDTMYIHTILTVRMKEIGF